MDANLLEAMETQEKLDKSSGTYRRATLRDIIVYGRVRCIVKRPSIIPDTLKDGKGFFCIVDVYALKCQNEDYFQDGSNYDINKLYFTKGSLIAYLADPARWIGRDVRLWGKSYGGKQYGCDIRRQGFEETSGISALVFGSPETVGHKRVYPIVCNGIEELAVGSRDCRGTILEEFMVKLASSKNSEIPYNRSLDSIIPFTGLESYEEIVMESPEDVVTTPEAPQQAPYKSVAVSPRTGNKTPDGRIDTSKIDMKLVYHLEGQPQSEFYEPFKQDIERCGESRDNWISDMMDAIYTVWDLEDNDYSSLVNRIRNGFINNIAHNYNGMVGRGNARCKDYVNKFVSNCESNPFDYDNGKCSEKIKKLMRNAFENLKKFVATNPDLLRGEDSSVGILPMLTDLNLFALNAISVCTGVSYEGMASSFRYLAREYEIGVPAFVRMLVYAPYFLGLITSGLSLPDCDSIYYGISKNSSSIGDFEDINSKTRSYMVMLNTLKSVCDGENAVCNKMESRVNTFVPISTYRVAVMHYDKRYISNIQHYGYPRGLDNREALKKVFENKSLGISEKERTNVLMEGTSWFNEDHLHELETIGAVNTMDSFIALEGAIEQEFCIYSTFEGMGKTPTGITEEQIKETVDNFEISRGFKLEPLQRDGVKLCMKRAGVLSGCAGSGKTTTSDCLTEVLKAYCDKMKIIYCTPTGKACRRLAEVVGGTVKTIHSQFHLGLGDGALIPQSYVKSNKPASGYNGSIFIMDEMAMCSTELMFNVARNITKNDMIFFLGDIKQLPPVGNGCPFKILMSMLPCVELGVSKRAAAGSLVNYNTTLINFMSDGVPTPLLYDDKTFIARPCDNTSLAKTTVDVFRGFMDGSLNGTKYSEDDIQVISGYQKETKASSIVKLNPALQNMLRVNSRHLFAVEKRNSDAKNYYLGDRVIYINSNSYDICRYIPDGPRTFKTLVTTGIVNGDVGKLVGVFKSNDVNFKECNILDYSEGSALRGDLSDDEIKALFNRREEREDTIRNDDAFRGDDFYFVAIQLYDTDLKRDVLVLLRARGKNLDGTLALSGGDLNNLDLAYALTCHKMQGSQSPVVIIPLESGSYPKFINRNMINTMVTRSQGIVCMIGDIDGHGSALDSGRKQVSSTDSHDLLSVLTGNLDWVE